jgi:adenine-specific DNA-methyltransferase
MILGDSLNVMASLAEREALRGKVQMIYIDPPYGIRFGSNWQVSARSRDVKDGKLADATREVEQIKAFRDTWELGIHSYLAYLRDRLSVAKDLLTESGSIFVQIGDENVHLVRSLVDEVFGSENFCAQIGFTKTASFSTELLSRTHDHLLWYGRNREATKYRRLLAPLQERTEGGTYTWVDIPGQQPRRMTREEIAGVKPLPPGARQFRAADITSAGASERGSAPVEIAGKEYSPSPGTHWKTTPEGIQRLAIAGRVSATANRLGYRRYSDDFPWMAYTDVWEDTTIGTFSEKWFVVQTSTRVVERCLLMTTDPGDLVLDPTCGSGTTAVVAEQWGRRWITIDTSRVALALARQRLMGARFPYYLLADSPEGRVKESELTGTELPPAETTGDIRHGFVYERVQHITLKSIANNPDIKEGMSREEIDAAIRRHAEYELLYDKPYEDKRKVRVSGPFTVESLSPHRSLAFAFSSTRSSRTRRLISRRSVSGTVPQMMVDRGGSGSRSGRSTAPSALRTSRTRRARPIAPATSTCCACWRSPSTPRWSAAGTAST